jgi:integrase
MKTDTDLEPLIEFLLGTKVAPPDMPWRLLRREDLQVARAWAAETLGPASQRRLGNALRRTLRAAPRDDDSEPSTDVPAWSARNVATRTSNPLSPREARLLLESNDERPTAAEARDGAIIALMLFAGLRRAELVRLQRGDYDEEEGLLRVRTADRALRVLLLQGPCQQHLDGWLRERGGVSGPLFLAINREDAVRLGGLSPSALNGILARRAQFAGIAGITPRDLRARFLLLLRSGQRTGAVGACRYYLTEDGQPAWTLPSLQSI